MAQHHPKQMRTLALALHHDPGTQPEVHLGFCTGFYLDAHEGSGLRLSQRTDKAFDRLIATAESLLAHQVLINALRRKPHRHRRFNLLLPGQTGTRTAGTEGRNGWFWF